MKIFIVLLTVRKKLSLIMWRIQRFEPLHYWIIGTKVRIGQDGGASILLFEHALLLSPLWGERKGEGYNAPDFFNEARQASLHNYSSIYVRSSTSGLRPTISQWTARVLSHSRKKNTHHIFGTMSYKERG